MKNSSKQSLETNSDSVLSNSLSNITKKRKFAKRTHLSLKRKYITSRAIFDINKYCKFLSLSLMKLLSKKVKNVKKPNNNVTKKIITINKFFLIKFSIMYNYMNS